MTSQQEKFIPSIILQEYQKGNLTKEQCKYYGLTYNNKNQLNQTQTIKTRQQGNRYKQDQQQDQDKSVQVQGRDLQAAYAKTWKDYSMLSVPPKNILYSKDNMLQSQIENIQDIQVKVYDQYQQQTFKPLEKFSDIKNINKTLLDNLINEDKCNYQTLLPVQKYATPVVLANRDLQVESNTGSGKTNAFLIPIIQKLLELKEKQPFNNSIKALIILPTRELAQQTIFNTYKLIDQCNLKAAVIYGGTQHSYEMIQNIKKNPDILIACPGKLKQMYFQKKLFLLNDVKFVVIDEADRCFDMGFQEDIKQILQETDMPKDRQTLMYSATFNGEIQDLCNKQLQQPVYLQIQQQQQEKQIIQTTVNVTYDTKYDELINILEKQFEENQEINQVIVFCNEKQQTKDLYSCLVEDQIQQHIFQLHGDMDQDDRTQNIANFKKCKKALLICTDACQRGLDFPGVQLVINFTCPNDIESYTHRIGRTGRAGRCGKAITFIEQTDNRNVLQYIQNQINKKENNHSNMNTRNNYNSNKNRYQNNKNKYNNTRRQNYNNRENNQKQVKQYDQDDIVIEIESQN